MMKQKNNWRRLSMGLVLGIGLVLLISAGLSASANPASPFPTEVTQADGSVVTVFGRGDEFFNWKEDESGNIIVYDADSANWCYARLRGSEIVPGPEALSEKKNQSERRVPSMPSAAPADRLTKNDILPLIENADRSSGQALPGAETETPGREQGGADYVVSITQTKNRKPLLVMLVEYNNQPFSASYLPAGSDTTQYWSNHYFGSTGKTVNSYYKEVSGDFNLQYVKPNFTVADGTTVTSGLPVGVSSLKIKDGVALVRLGKSHPGTGKTGGANSDEVTTDLKLAFDAVKSHVNFISMGIPSMTQVLSNDFTIASVIAGYDGSSGSGTTPSVWGHAKSVWYTAGKYVSINNNTLSSYATQGEMNSSSGAMPLGVTVHELAHTLGLPDLYSDYRKSGAKDIGVYSLMAYGSWGTDTPGSADPKSGNTPVHLDAWSKMRLGFIPGAYITTTKFLDTTMNSIAAADGYNALRITPSVNAKEYFVIENRQLTGYDRGIAGVSKGENGGGAFGGILVWHIDEAPLEAYERNRNGYRGNDNDGHLGVELENYPSNPFFKAGGAFEFNASSSPNSNFHTPGHNANASYYTDCHPQTVPSNVQIQFIGESSDSMEIVVGPFVPVANITGVPAGMAAGVPLRLNGTVNPADASYKNIIWSIDSFTTASASIPAGSGNLVTTGTGTVTLRATILKGLGTDLEYTTTFTILVAAHEFTLDKSGTHTFPAAEFGYGAPAPVSIQASNTGPVPTGPLSVTLAGANPGSFTLSGATLASLALGGSGTFTVTPKTGLNPGTYSATVLVSVAGVEKSFGVSFTVKPSSAKEITGVIAPSGAAVSANTISASVGYGISQVTPQVSVSPAAAWQLCSDAAGVNVISSLPLAVGANTVYIKVTAQDLSTKIYTLTVTRRDASSVFQGGRITLNRKQDHAVFRNAIANYGAALRFVSSGKINVSSNGTITYRWASIGNATVTAFDAVTGAWVASQDVKVAWQWWQWLMVVFLFGWAYL